MSDDNYTNAGDLTPEQIEIVNANWDRANQFVNEMIFDHVDHLNGDTCAVPSCTSREFATMMDQLNDTQAKIAAHVAIVRLAKLIGDETNV